MTSSSVAEPPRGSHPASGAVRHIVMWTFKDTAEGASRAANLAKARTLLLGCADCVPGILAFDVGLAAEGLESNYDLVLDATFASRDALHAYQAHPTHEAIKGFMAAAREQRACVDFEVA